LPYLPGVGAAELAPDPFHAHNLKRRVPHPNKPKPGASPYDAPTPIPEDPEVCKEEPGYYTPLNSTIETEAKKHKLTHSEED